MRSRLRLFGLVGVIATAIDLGLLLFLADRWGVLGADLAALTAAAVVSYLLNRNLTFRGDRAARWVRRPSLFAATAVVAGTLDLVLVVAADAIGVVLVVAKAGAIVAAAVLRWVAYRRILFVEVRQELAERVDRPTPPGAVRASIVLPAYNEATMIAASVTAVSAAMDDALGGDYEVIVVDDGSSDDTAVVAGSAGAQVVRLAENRGKGAAVRAGVLAASGRAIVFTDADLAYPAPLLGDVIAEVEKGWDVVVGSRRHEDTNTLVRTRRIRELGGRVINLLTHVVLLGHFRDTQCGIKGFRSDIGRTIFERTRIDGFAFDVELFLIAEQDRLSLIEIPVSVSYRPGSTVRLVGDTAALLADLLRIRRWAGEGHYRPTPTQAAILEARSRPNDVSG